MKYDAFYAMVLMLPLQWCRFDINILNYDARFAPNLMYIFQKIGAMFIVIFTDR